MNWYVLSQSNAVNTSSTYEDDILELYKDRWEQVDSSFISAIAYYKSSAVLEVKMTNGRIYTFMGVPEKIYEQLKKSPSKGKFFNSVIRKNYVSN